MKLDYLDGTPYKIYQEKDMYHFNSDTELLGKYIKLNSNDKVLDIGTNNGALLFYASIFNPSLLVGIDIFDEVIAVAKKNLDINNVKACVYVSRVQDFMHDKFSVIICNPPYFNSLNDASNKYILAARHENYLSLEDLFIACARLLDDDGVIHIVYPYKLRDNLISKAISYDFNPFRYRISYDKKGGNIKSFIVSFSKNKCDVVERCLPAYMNDRNSFTL